VPGEHGRGSRRRDSAARSAWSIISRPRRGGHLGQLTSYVCPCQPQGSPRGGQASLNRTLRPASGRFAAFDLQGSGCVEDGARCRIAAGSGSGSWRAMAGYPVSTIARSSTGTACPPARGAPAPMPAYTARDRGQALFSPSKMFSASSQFPALTAALANTPPQVLLSRARGVCDGHTFSELTRSWRSVHRVAPDGPQNRGGSGIIVPLKRGDPLLVESQGLQMFRPRRRRRLGLCRDGRHLRRTDHIARGIG
jgi:hypothetical protein